MNHKPKTGRHQSGFTLMELMFGILIAAILMAVAVPSFKTMTANSRLSAQAMDLVGAVNIARSEAIRRNGTITMCRVSTVAATSCAGSQAAWGFWIITNTAGTILRRDAINTYGTSLKVTSTFTNDTIAFTSDGLAHNASATGTLVNASAETNYFSVCTKPTTTTYNIRKATLGASSRMSTSKASGSC